MEFTQQREGDRVTYSVRMWGVHLGCTGRWIRICHAPEHLLRKAPLYNWHKMVTCSAPGPFIDMDLRREDTVAYLLLYVWLYATEVIIILFYCLVVCLYFLCSVLCLNGWCFSG